MSTSKTEVEVIVFVAIMLHKVDNDFYFYYYFIYGRIPKISPRTYIFQRPFLRGLYSEGHLRREICVSKSNGLALYLEVN